MEVAVAPEVNISFTDIPSSLDLTAISSMRLIIIVEVIGYQT